MCSPAEEEEEEEEEKKQEEEEEEENKITGRKIKESCKQGFCVFPGFFFGFLYNTLGLYNYS